MKKYTCLLAFLLGLCSLWSCENDDISPELTYTEPSMIENLPFLQIRLEQPDGNENPLLCTVKWSATRFFLDNSGEPAATVPVSYTLQADRAGNDFAEAQVLAAGTSLSADLYVKTFNEFLLSTLKTEAGQPVELELRVVTNYGEGEDDYVVSGNRIPFTVTPYVATKAMQAIYLVGDMNGWNNQNTDFILFRNSNDPADQVYTYTGRLAGGCYFKFCPEQSLGTYKMYCRQDDTHFSYEEREDGAFYNETEGYKTITLNLADMTYSIVDYDATAARVYGKIGPIGEFCGWDNEPALTVSPYDPHLWKGNVTFDASTTCKFRGDNDWSQNWGGQAADYPYGKGVFDGPGASVQPGNYDIYFNDLTGHYIIMKK